MILLNWFLDLIFPRKCILCRSILSAREQDICHSCRENPPESPDFMENLHPGKNSGLHFLDSFTAVWYYEKNVRESLLRFKFHGARYYAAPYGRFLAMRLLQRSDPDWDVLTWVPVSRRRKLSRGYDQTELLTRAVGREIGMKPVAVLKKVRNNLPQSSMPHDCRKANVRGVFALRNGADVAGKRVLLLDDILTTGATAEECASILRRAGAREVHCAVVAKARKNMGV